MKTEIEIITPIRALEMLERNTLNRPIRKGWVRTLSDAITRGEWKLTHQGIAISKTGQLLDGQHRLHAIVRADKKVPVMVAYDIEEDAFDSIDLGIKRTVSDATRTNPEAMAALTALTRVVFHQERVSPQFIMNSVGIFLPLSIELLEYASKKRKIVSSSPVRAAAIVRIAQMPQEKANIFNMYRAITLADFGNMPPIAHSFMRHTMDRGKNSSEWFAYAFRMFHPNWREYDKLTIKDPANLLDEARVFVKEYLKQNSNYRD